MDRYNNQQDFDFLDMIEIMAFIIQVLDYEVTMKQATNDDVIRELHRQNTAYLERIEKQLDRVERLLMNT